MIRCILLSVWPLSDRQRKHLYLGLVPDEAFSVRLLGPDETVESISQARKYPLYPGLDRLAEPVVDDSDSGSLIENRRDDSNLLGSKLTLNKLKPDSRESVKTLRVDAQSATIVDPDSSGLHSKSAMMIQIPQNSIKSTNMQTSLKTVDTGFCSPKYHSSIPHRSEKRYEVTRSPPLNARARPKSRPRMAAKKPISKDVKRTYKHREDFDHASLELILSNMTRPERGSFNYYQGLNYLVAYVLDLLRDPSDTYALCMGLADTHLRPYIGDSLEGVDVLAHVLRRLVELFVAGLAVHVNSDSNMVNSATSASWMLTVFTMLKKLKRRVRLLDQVVDIFVAQGWAGFFKCVLVMFYYLESDLAKCQNEEMLIFMNDFAKRGFQKLGEVFPAKGQTKNKSVVFYSEQRIQKVEPGQISVKEIDRSAFGEPQFDFKREIRRFDLVNEHLLADLAAEYTKAKKVYDQSLRNVLRKVEMILKK